MRSRAAKCLCLAGLLALAGGLGGCAGGGREAVGAGTPVPDSAPLAAPQGEVGRIYFYRSDLPVMVALAPEVIVNGREVGKAGYEAVFYRDALPGRYEVFLETDPDHPVYFTLAPGELRFVKATMALDWGGTRMTVALVEPETARREIAEQRRLRANPPEPRTRPSR
jgi:hypothetical protein